MLHHYYRHWKLYKVCFTRRLCVTFTQTAPFAVEVPGPHRPLASMIPLGSEIAPDADPAAPAPAPADDATVASGA